jgi:hypothetical protein
MNKFEKGDMDWLKRILTGTELITADGYMDNILSHGRTERIVNYIEQLKERIKLLEQYTDHKPECQRATIHRAYFSDKYPCECGFDDLGVELKFYPVDKSKKK